MAAIAQIKIDLSKLDKSKIYEAKSGAKYYEFTISINDKTSQYGENISASDSQSKEERDSKADRKFIGGGKVIWVSEDGISVAEKTGETQKPQPQKVDNSLPF